MYTSAPTTFHANIFFVDNVAHVRGERLQKESLEAGTGSAADGGPAGDGSRQGAGGRRGGSAASRVGGRIMASLGGGTDGNEGEDVYWSLSISVDRIIE